MNWTELDWPALDRLRDGFLRGDAARGPYWESASALASYDATYGERIGWKWDQVLRELQLRSWRPQARTVLDWGCGSGVAARRIIQHFGPEQFDTLRCWDHDPLAVDYAVAAAGRHFPQLRIEAVTPGWLQGDGSVGLLVISHVLNELAESELTALRGLLARAESVLWVEPGTHAISRRLGAIREAVRDTLHVVAPCTHELACPMFAPGNDRHWCHFFAPPPAEVFADSDWVRFGRRAGLDLRSLPYCFLALDRRPPALAPGWSRIIGRPEAFKPYTRWLNCDASGLADLTLSKRASPDLHKALARTKALLVYRWQREPGTVIAGRALADTEAATAGNPAQP